MDKLNQQTQNWLDDNEDTMYQEDESNTIIREPHRVVLLGDVEAKLLEMQTEIERLKRGLNAIANWEKCSPEDTNEVVALLKELAKGVTPK